MTRGLPYYLPRRPPPPSYNYQYHPPAPPAPPPHPSTQYSLEYIPNQPSYQVNENLSTVLQNIYFPE